MTEAVVFDMDGVLVDSEPVWERVRREVVAAHGGHYTDDVEHRIIGMSTPEWSRYLHEELGVRLAPARVAEVVIGRMVDHYAERLPLIDGAVAAVRRLAEHWPLGLASSSPAVLIETVLAGAGIRSLFSSVLSTEEVPRGKPWPDVYLTTAQRLGRSPGDCVAIEDSSNGMRSAAAAGLRLIAVPHPAYPPAPDALALADTVLPGIGALTPDTVRGLRADRTVI